MKNIIDKNSRQSFNYEKLQSQKMSIDITNDELFKSQRDFDLIEEISVIDDDCSSNSSNASKSHKMAKPM